MKKIYILTRLILITVLISGCAQQILDKEKPAEKNETVSQEFCEVGKEYGHNAVNPVTCKCPEGYEFETVSMGWGPCPPGLGDCPASVLKCVKKIR